MSNDFDALTALQKNELADLIISQMAALSKSPFKPVDMANLQFLDDGNGSWVDEIVQLMPGNAVSAGAPDPVNNKGLFNWPLQQLAQRTAHLRAGLVPLATEAEVLAAALASKSVSPLHMKKFVEKRLGISGDGLPLLVELSNSGRPGQTVAANVPVRCNNMVAVGGNAGGLWNGHRYTVDANSLGIYGVFNRLNIATERGEGAQTWVNGTKVAFYQLSVEAGSSNIVPFTHFVSLTEVGDYVEFYHSHRSSTSKQNSGSMAQIFRLLPYQPAV